MARIRHTQNPHTNDPKPKRNEPPPRMRELGGSPGYRDAEFRDILLFHFICLGWEGIALSSRHIRTRAGSHVRKYAKATDGWLGVGFCGVGRIGDVWRLYWIARRILMTSEKDRNAWPMKRASVAFFIVRLFRAFLVSGGFYWFVIRCGF